jgi:hypothetical protein
MPNQKNSETPEQAHERGLAQLDSNREHKHGRGHEDGSHKPSVIEDPEPRQPAAPGETAGEAHRNGPLPNKR